MKRKSTLSILRETFRGVCVKRLTNRRGAWHKRRYKAAFTLIELLIVIAIIVVLTGLILTTIGYVQKKEARVRAETEIAAISAACESYKADNGIYPRGPTTSMTVGSTTIPANATDNLNAKASGDPTSTAYSQASLYLYTQLSGDLTGNLQPTGKSYFAFKPQMLGGTKDANGNLISVQYIRDPFGNSYGYSTAQAANPGGTAGYNSTFDLWSTAGLTTNPPSSGTDTVTPQWIKNW